MADQIVIAGSGVSTGIPVIGHLGTNCACKRAMESPENKNNRNNVSLLIRRLRPENSPPVIAPPSEGVAKDSYERKKKNPFPKYNNILIDAGKTFRDSYFKVMAPLGVDFLNSILITHDHADAMAGLDDVRDLQYFTFVEDGSGMKCEHYIPTYMSTKTFKTLTSQSGYITKNGIQRGPHDKASSAEELAEVESKKQEVKRLRATSLEFFDLNDQAVERVQVVGLEGVPFYTFPVFHGGEYRSMCYAFGGGIHQKVVRPAGGSGDDVDDEGSQVAPSGSSIVYISDVSGVPDDTMAFLLSLERIDVLFLDLLLGYGETHFSHFVMDQFLDLIFKLQPKEAYGIGMFCCLEHDKTNRQLKRELLKHKEENPQSKIEVMACGYDGQAFGVTL